jgi:hypothetical protein
MPALNAIRASNVVGLADTETLKIAAIATTSSPGLS